MYYILLLKIAYIDIVIYVTLSMYFLTVLLFQHFFQTRCLVLSSTYQRAICVLINVVDIKPIFVSIISFTANPTDSSIYIPFAENYGCLTVPTTSTFPAFTLNFLNIHWISLNQMTRALCFYFSISFRPSVSTKHIHHVILDNIYLVKFSYLNQMEEKKLCYYFK